jgi:hypothetical protein
MLFRAFAARLAAVQGGSLRDGGTWNDRILTPPANIKEHIMGRGILLWLLGVQMPIVILPALFSH